MRRSTLTARVAVAAVAVVMSGTTAAFAQDRGDAVPGAYKLVPPQTFRDLVWMDDSAAAQGVRAAQSGITFPPGITPLGTAYGKDGQATLIISGVFGPVQDPVGGLAHGFANLRAFGAVSAPEAFEPGRLGGELECATVALAQGGTLDACGWSDHSSVIIVVPRTPVRQVSLAAEVRQLRDAMEVPNTGS